jgi:hypothetical protein
MATQEVIRADWPEFLAAFSGQHDGWLISLDRYDAHARRARHREGALRGVAVEGPNAGAIAIRIDDEDTGRCETEVINAPRRVAVERAGDRIDAGLDIDAPQGRITLRFHHPMPPELVDGVAP